MSGSVRRIGIDDIDVNEVWKRLQEEVDAVLVDVRTRAEWNFVGMPDVSQLEKQLLMVEWQSYPGGMVNPYFAGQLEGELDAVGADKGTSLFFICRSGGRSLAAAQAMAAAGYRACHNVADGFEGPHDEARQRGSAAGWKAAGLPWIQG